MSKGAKMVSASIVGVDVTSVMVNEKVYIISPPTIHKLAGAGLYISDFGEEQDLGGIIRSINDSEKLAHALSWLINDDDSLHEELSHGTFDELVDAICEAYSLISVESFTKLSTLAKNVARLIANHK